jgi:hypothetical protein
MTGLDYFTFVVLAVLIGVGVFLAIALGALPGKIADQRGHPQADAIRVAGWLGLLTMGLLWPFALIWAYTRVTSEEETAALRNSIDRLGERVAAVERKGVVGLDEEQTDS